MRPHRSSRCNLALGLALAVLLGAAPAAAEDPPAPAPEPAQAPAPAAPAAPAAAGPPTWYAQALARGEAGLNVTHFWSKGPKLRAETVVAGHKVVTIVSGDTYYAYDGLTGFGLAIRRDPAAIAKDATIRRPFGNEYDLLIRQKAEIVREEELLGRKTGILRVTDDHGRRELWVTLDEQHLPLRIEIYDRKTSQSRFTDYLNWQSQLPIPDDFFQPDSNAKLEAMDLAEYMELTSKVGPVGPVPVLYLDLLHVKRDE